LTSGDVVLFSGRNPLHRMIQDRTKSQWSQVGIVLCLPGLIEPCLLAATSFPIIPDIETGELRTGVTTTLLYPTVRAFDGRASARRLARPLTPQSVDQLRSVRNSVIGHAFDFSLLSMRRTLRRCHTTWQPDVFMCASLVAFAYQSIDILPVPPRGPLPNNVWPCDFSTDGNLTLDHGYSLT
jgi:hypothetical protein